MNNLEQEIINHVEAATRAIYSTVPVDLVHPIEHTERVVVNTLRICQGDKIPLLRPVAAAWLHDIGRPAEYLAHQNGTRLHHAEESAGQVPIILRPFRDSLGEDIIQEIQTAVAIHSQLNSPDDSLTAMILKDADRLEGLGSVGLYRTITASRNNRFVDPSDPFPNTRIELADATKPEITLVQRMLTTIEWFAMLRMPTALRIGLPRVQKQIGFLEGLVEELDLSRDLLEQNPIIQEARQAMRRVPNASSFHTL